MTLHDGRPPVTQKGFQRTADESDLAVTEPREKAVCQVAIPVVYVGQNQIGDCEDRFAGSTS